MKLPNSYGSVYKLSGKRRNPWAARVTVGWKSIPENQRAYPVYDFIGYFPTKTEALQALAAYNQNPYDINSETITFKEVYEKWAEKYFDKISKSNATAYKAAFATCKGLWNMRFKDIKLNHLQKAVDDSGKNTPTLKKVKNLFSLLYEYAIIHEIVTADKRDLVKYIDISKPGNPNAQHRQPFTKADIKTLWDAALSDEYVSIILIPIYTGVRISELLNLKKSDVHIDDSWFFVRKSKTRAGIREVPISDKIMPFFKHWTQKDSEYLVCRPNGRHLNYRTYYDTYWTPAIKRLCSRPYTPLCTRHTCISLLTEAGVDERIIQDIVGHKGQSVTQAVYTHIDLQAKLEAINKIQVEV